MVARGGIEPPTRGFSVARWATLTVRKPKIGGGFSRAAGRTRRGPILFRSRPSIRCRRDHKICETKQVWFAATEHLPTPKLVSKTNYLGPLPRDWNRSPGRVPPIGAAMRVRDTYRPRHAQVGHIPNASDHDQELATPLARKKESFGTQSASNRTWPHLPAHLVIHSNLI